MTDLVLFFLDVRLYSNGLSCTNGKSSTVPLLLNDREVDGAGIFDSLDPVEGGGCFLSFDGFALGSW